MSSQSTGIFSLRCGGRNCWFFGSNVYAAVGPVGSPSSGMPVPTIEVVAVTYFCTFRPERNTTDIILTIIGSSIHASYLLGVYLWNIFANIDLIVLTYSMVSMIRFVVLFMKILNFLFHDALVYSRGYS